jgi:hypothetical protein
MSFDEKKNGRSIFDSKAARREGNGFCRSRDRDVAPHPPQQKHCQPGGNP